MSRERRNIWDKFIRISTDTYTEWDKDGCDYYWKNKNWEKKKHSNAVNNDLKKSKNIVIEKELECWRCHWTGKVMTRDGSYNSWPWDWRGNSIITCPKCLWKWKINNN